MMKRFLSLLLAAVLVCSLAGCGGAPAQQDEARLRVVATAFPFYDWVRNVVGDVPGVELTWLMDTGVDPHSFQPSVDDLLKVTNSDVFVFVGGESDQWTADAVTQMADPNACAVPLLTVIGLAAVEEEDVPGAEPEKEETPGALDEHIWMSLKNAAVCVQAIADVMADRDPDHADEYRANAKAYIAQLNALDADYAQAVAESPLHTIIVADRFPFRYLAEDYGLDYFAAFSGCSAETEASFETVLTLAKQTDALGVPVLLTIDGGRESICDAVRDAAKSDPAVRVLNSLQTVTADDAAAGMTYLSVMTDNLDVLKEALAWHS